ELGGRLRAVLEQERAHAVASAAVVGGRRRAGVHYSGVHNTSVSYFGDAATKGDLTPGDTSDEAHHRCPPPSIGACRSCPPPSPPPRSPAWRWSTRSPTGSSSSPAARCG